MEQIKRKLTELVRDTVAGISINDEKDYDRSLKDLGVDSLDMMSILLEIFDRYKIDISDEEAEKLTSLNLIIVHIDKELKKRNQVG